jgi:putative flippase GtrA
MITRWLKFNAAGILGVGVQLALLHSLTRFAQLGYLVATAFAVETALIHNFLWHERYTWRIRTAQAPRAALRRFVHFNVTNGVVSLVGNLLLMKLLVDHANLPVVVANLIAIAACSTFNFAIAEIFVFAVRREPHDEGLFV